MTAPKPAPRAIQWGACERCRGGGSASPLDARFCAICLPPPEVSRDRAAVVERRVRLARRAANRTDSLTTEAPVSPDAEHIWLQLNNCRVAHLFADAAQIAYCRRIRLRPLGRSARADIDTPAPENGAACRSCWTAYRSGRGRP